MHCGANTYHASSAKAVASDQPCAMTGVSVSATASRAADSEYAVPSAPTATSRAASPGTSAIEICQLKPIGANRCCSPWPSQPAMLYWIAGPVAPAGGAGYVDRNHSTTISEKM